MPGICKTRILGDKTRILGVIETPFLRPPHNAHPNIPSPKDHLRTFLYQFHPFFGCLCLVPGSFISGDYCYSKLFFMSENYFIIKDSRYLHRVAC